MTKAESKSTLIAEILKQTGAEGEKYFDKLSEHSVKYLSKLLKVINAL